MKYILFLAGLLSILVAPGCVRKRLEPGVRAALADAGSNRKELVKVLEHYSAPGDSLKLKAAEFLIANMPYHFGYYGGDIDKYGIIFSLIDSLSYFKQTVTVEDKMHIGDSLLSLYGAPGNGRIRMIPDTRIVSGDYLITNIDYAVKAWRQAPWGRQVKFEDFCEFILPYRVRNEQVEYWRPACFQDYTRMAQHYPYADSLSFVYNAMNWDLVTEGTFTMYFNKYFPFPKSLDQEIKGKIGGCETTTFFSATAMRAAGLPIASEFIPHWGNVNSSHYMLHLMDSNKPKFLITNENKPVSTWKVVEWSSLFDEHRHLFTADELPAGMYIQYAYTIPKIYRHTFSRDEELAKINRSIPENEISPEFRHANFKDVTGEYVQCSDFDLYLGPALRKFRLAYLCVFDVDGWKPVALSRVDHDSAIFRKIGRNVLYLPSVYDHGLFKPAGSPFYIDGSNKLHTVTKEAGRRQDLHLVRKISLYPYTVCHSEVVRGGRFEGSNAPDFKHPVLLDSIESYPFYMNEVIIRHPGHYRYLRYVAPHTEVQESDNIAEVQFYEAGREDMLTGDFIGSEGSPGHEIARAFDNNMDSYYENKNGKDGWIGIDLGKKSRAKVARIRFCPRNDTNCIIPGEDYELFYWDGEWISLGTQKAVRDYLDYPDMPSGALFWLKCLSNGHEERVFTYEQGKQRWW